MERFSQGGAEALVIENMASALQCSKSSFYWYFANRGAFVRSIVERWIELTTGEVVAAASLPLTAEEKFTELLHQMFGVTQKGDFLFYLRRLSAHEPEYQTMLEMMERVRLEFAQGLFERLGLSIAAAEQNAWFLYHYYLGWYERHKLQPVSSAEVEEHVESLRSLLLPSESKGELA